MTYTLLFFGLLFVHFLADFLVQTDWQAVNKSKDVEALSRHVATYTATFLIFLPFMCEVTIGRVPSSIIILFCVATFATHWITDYVTSRIAAYYYQKEDRHAFFAMVGLDQFIHQATLLLTMNQLLVS